MKISAILNKPTPTDRVLAAAEAVPAGEVLTGHELAAKMGISLSRFAKYAMDVNERDLIRFLTKLADTANLGSFVPGEDGFGGEFEANPKAMLALRAAYDRGKYDALPRLNAQPCTNSYFRVDLKEPHES